MKKFLSLVLVLVMTMSLVTISAGAKSFTDDSSIAYKEAVDVVSELKIVDGYEDGAFNPQNTLTRGAAAKIICNLILGPTTASALSADTAPFSDVPTSNTFAGYIAYCSQKGIISGYADGTFRPAATLTGYAFMKMLLGALGYDAAIENYTGANWSVNVGKQALGIDLDDGNDSFVGTQAVTREEACLYAFNTLKATMVEYENQSSIVIGDITVNTSSKYKDKTCTLGSGNDGNIKRDGKVQFAEEFFGNLKKTSDTDEFNRPATTWKIKSASIGTYSNTPDATYTEEVKMGTIYSDLGLSSNVVKADVETYVNGTSTTSYAIAKNDTSNKLGGNGVLTEVFYDDDNDTAIITLVNTYLGEITATHKATSSKDAYVTVAPKADAVSAGGNFDTEEDFDVDDLVLYTYSTKTGDVGVQSVVAAPESVTGTLTSYTANKNVTVAGTTYKANEANKADITGDNLSNAVDQEVTVYLDAYGYVLFVDTDAISGNYAVVVGLGNSTLNDQAKLLFSDATTKTVDVASGFTGLAVNDIVSYTTKSNGDYKLTKLADNTTRRGDITKKGSSNLNNIAANLTSSSTTVNYANGKTIFLVATATSSGTDYKAYTGIANVPDITSTRARPVTAYVKTVSSSTNSGAATLVYIDATAYTTVSGSSKDVVFVKGGSTGVSHSSALGDYYQYTAIVNGEIVSDFKTENRVTAYTLFNNVSYDANGVATVSNGVAKGAKDASYTPASGDGVFFTVNGTEKVSNDVVGLGNSYYTYSSDCKVFRMNEDGDITDSVYTASSIYKDENDLVWFKMVDGDVTFIVIQDVEAASPTTPTGPSNVTYVDGGTVNAPRFYYDDATVHTVTDAETVALLTAAGASDITKNGSNWNYTHGGISYTGQTVTPVQFFKVSVNGTVVGYMNASTAYSATVDNTVGAGYMIDSSTNDTYAYATYSGTTVSVQKAYDVEIETGYLPFTSLAVSGTGADTVFGTTYSYAVNGGTASTTAPTHVKNGDEVEITLTVAAETAVLGATSKATLTAGGVTGIALDCFCADADFVNTSAAVVTFDAASASLKAGDTVTITLTAPTAATCDPTLVYVAGTNP